MQFLRAFSVIALTLPVTARLQQSDRFTLTGERVAIENVAGRVTVVAGTGSAVVVEVTRGGRDGGLLRFEERTVDGRATLCVTFPDERIIYRRDDSGAASRRRDSWTTTNSGTSLCEDRGRNGRGRRVEVASSGSGVEAWADIRVHVPTGRNVTLRHIVGDVDVNGVDATLDLDVASASVTMQRTRGAASVDAGSGRVSISQHTGDLSVDVGSGSVDLNAVDARTLNVDSGSGTLRGTDVTADDLTLDTGSGSVEFSGVRARRVRVDTGSGDAEIALVAQVDALDIDTGSGGVTLVLPNDFGASLDLQSGSGRVTSDFPLQTTRSRRDELRGTIGDGRARVTIDAGSGDVRLVRGSTARRGAAR